MSLRLFDQLLPLLRFWRHTVAMQPVESGVFGYSDESARNKRQQLERRASVPSGILVQAFPTLLAHSL